MKYSPDYYAQILYSTKDVDVFFALIKRHWVTQWLPKILARYQAMVRRGEGIVTMNVVSARVLSQEAKEHIEDMVSGYARAKKLEFTYQIDTDVLGGFRVSSEQMRVNASALDQLRSIFS